MTTSIWHRETEEALQSLCHRLSVRIGLIVRTSLTFLVVSVRHALTFAIPYIEFCQMQDGLVEKQDCQPYLPRSRSEDTSILHSFSLLCHRG